jgi:hypothetical protein
MDTEIVNEGDQAKRFRWWFLPSWLGLDAPCVVSTWTWAVSRASGTSLPIRSVAAMFLVVWLIYLSDRLIDVSLCRDWTNATGRMKFGRDFRSLFLGCLGLCIIGIFGLMLTGLPGEVIRRAMLVACGVVLHALVFVTPVFISRKLPGKEFGVGFFFALGAYACLGASKQTLPLFVSIAAVVAFNCLVIAARDADCDRTSDPGGASRWWHTMNRDLFWLGVVLTAVAVLSSILTSATPFFVSLAVAFTLLTALHHVAQRLSGDAVRALADFALFTPVVFMNPLIGMN